jgi:hypothetical protein
MILGLWSFKLFFSFEHLRSNTLYQLEFKLEKIIWDLETFRKCKKNIVDRPSETVDILE